MNKVILTGRLTKDIVLQQYNNGQDIDTRFVLAVDRPVSKDANGNRQADFIGCVAFKQNADFLSKYCHKGDKIGVEGRIQTGSYQQDGQTKYTEDVIVDRVEIEMQVQVQQPQQNQYGTNPYQGYNNPQPQAQQQVPNTFNVPQDDGLPF